MSSEESLSVAALAASGDTSNANPGDDFQQEPTEATTESPAPATAAATESPFMEPSKDAGTTSPPPPVKAAAGEPPNSPRGTQAAEALAKIWKKDADDDQPQTFPQVVSCVCVCVCVCVCGVMCWRKNRLCFLFSQKVLVSPLPT
jgi:hypothetical protein